MTPVIKQVLTWLGLLLAGAVALNVAARIVASIIPFLITWAFFVLILAVAFGFFTNSK
jgi:hypothetical protein